MISQKPENSSIDSACDVRHVGLDTLRAFAILLVFTYHFPWRRVGIIPTGALAVVAKIGWCGVELFFVLSGFLIAAQLFRENTPVGVFYLRRAFRIWPLYLFVLALYFAFPPLRDGKNLLPVGYYLTLTQNLAFDHLREKAFKVSWSLCVEEHFYLLLPLIWRALRNRTKTWHCAAPVFFCAGVGLVGRALSARYFLTRAAENPVFFEWANFPTYNRLDGLVLGVALAAVSTFRPELWQRQLRFAKWWFLGGVATLAVVNRLYGNIYSPAALVVSFPLAGLAFSAILISALSPNFLLARFRIPGARFIADIAYPLYLIHASLRYFVFNQPGFPPWVHQGYPAYFFLLALAIVIAAGLNLLIGQPFLRLRNRVLEKIAAGTLRPWSVLAWAVTGVNVGAVLVTTITLGEAAGPPGTSLIDTQNYGHGVWRIVSTGSLLNVSIFYSPGYQIYLYAVRALPGGVLHFFELNRIWAWGWMLLTLWLVVKLAKRFFDAEVAALTAALLSSSVLYRTYVQIIGYEIFAGLLITLFTFLVVKALDERRPRATLGWTVAAGGSALALAFLHPRFLPVIVLGAAVLSWRTKRKTLFVACLLPLVLVGGAWSVVQTYRFKTPVIITAGWSRQFRLGNNPYSDGFNGPVQTRSEFGVAYARENPARVAKLVVIRFFRCWGFYRDPWTIEPAWWSDLAGGNVATSRTRKLLAAGWLLCFLIPFAAIARRPRRREELGVLYAVILGGILAPLPFFGNTRYLVPFLPVIQIFRAVAILRLVRAVRPGLRAAGSFARGPAIGSRRLIPVGG